MAKFINTTEGFLYFGRFKVKSGEAVPAVDYTDVEQADIERFVAKGILVNDDSVPAQVEEETKVEEPTEVKDPAEVEEPVQDKQAEGKKKNK